MQLTKNLYYYPENGMMDCNTYLIKDKLTIIIDTGLTQFLPSLIQQLHSDVFGVVLGLASVVGAEAAHLHLFHRSQVFDLHAALLLGLDRVVPEESEVRAADDDVRFLGHFVDVLMFGRFRPGGRAARLTVFIGRSGRS